MRRCVVVVALLCGAPLSSAQETATNMVEWRYVGADQGVSKYSPLADINRSNVDRLEIVWTWQPNELANAEYQTLPGTYPTCDGVQN